MVRILLAEDDEIMRITVRDRLVKNHWQVDTVSNGKEAIQKLKQERYGLVISDIQMPELDGWGVLGFLRKSCPGTGILLMTGIGENNSLASSVLHKGTEDFILKPFDLEDLVFRVNHLLDRHEEE